MAWYSGSKPITKAAVLPWLLIRPAFQRRLEKPPETLAVQESTGRARQVSL